MSHADALPDAPSFRFSCTLCGHMELVAEARGIDHLMSGILAHYTTSHPDLTRELWLAAKVETTG